MDTLNIIIQLAILVFFAGVFYTRVGQLEKEVRKLALLTEAKDLIRKADLDAFEARFKENIGLIIENAFLKSREKKSVSRRTKE